MDELRHFLAVHREGSFTAASRAVHLSQPALTASIQRLEARFGARLVDRGRRGARLTAAGEALRPRALAVLSAVADCERAVAEVQGLQAGEVRLAAGATACTVLLPELLAAFHREAPKVHLRLVETDTMGVAERLLEGRVDLGIVTETGLPDTPALVSEAWRADALVRVAAPDADPADHRFIAFPTGSPLRRLLDQHLPEAEVVMELGAIPAVASHVAAGIGHALVPQVAVERLLADGRLVVVDDSRCPIVRTLALVRRRDRSLSPAAAALRARLMAGDVGAKVP